MARLSIILGLILWVSTCSAQSLRQQIIGLASSQIGYKETSENSGPEVDIYIRSCNLEPPIEWCGTFSYWVFDSCGASTPTNPEWSPNWFPKNRLIAEIDGVYTASSVGYYKSSKGRIGHVGIVKAIDGKDVLVISGNDNDAVRLRRTPITKNIYFSDWVGTNPDYHLVKPQETLYRISITYGVSIDKLMQLNNLKNYRIQVGQKIWLN